MFLASILNCDIHHSLPGNGVLLQFLFQQLFIVFLPQHYDTRIGFQCLRGNNELL